MAIKVDGKIVNTRLAQTKIKTKKQLLNEDNPDYWLYKNVWFFEGTTLFHGKVEKVLGPQDVRIKAINQSKTENPDGKSQYKSIQIKDLRVG